MGLSAEQLGEALAALGRIEPRIAKVIADLGLPEPRIRPRGYETLLRTIVGQQVSVKAAAAVWNKLEAARGDLTNPDSVLSASFDELRACGLSRQKQGYARSLGELVKSGELEFKLLSGVIADRRKLLEHFCKSVCDQPVVGLLLHLHKVWRDGQWFLVVAEKLLLYCLHIY